MTSYFAGIGSRETPQIFLKTMAQVSKELTRKGWILRSGGADGADKAFETGVINNRKEIYNPRWTDIPQWAYDTVDKYHPAPDRLSDYARKLHARNAMIILGPEKDSTPCSLVICWTKGGKAIGGTAQGLRIAEDHGIPILNYGVVYESITGR